MYKAFLPTKDNRSKWRIVDLALCGKFHKAPIQVDRDQVWVNYIGTSPHINILALVEWPNGEPLHTLSMRKTRGLLDPTLENLIERIHRWDGATFDFHDADLWQQIRALDICTK